MSTTRDPFIPYNCRPLKKPPHIGYATRTVQGSSKLFFLVLLPFPFSPPSRQMRAEEIADSQSKYGINPSFPSLIWEATEFTSSGAISFFFSVMRGKTLYVMDFWKRFNFWPPALMAHNPRVLFFTGQASADRRLEVFARTFFFCSFSFPLPLFFILVRAASVVHN